MISNEDSLFDSFLLDLHQPSPYDIMGESITDCKIMNEFPSICELDPTEAVEKKNCRSDVLGKIFENPFSLEGSKQETTPSKKEGFSFNTEELLDELVQITQDKSKNSVEDKIECILPSILDHSPAKRSMDTKDNTEKVKSFNNRTRFSKKHDREMFLVLNQLCKEAQISLSDFEGTQYPLPDDLMKILDKLIEKIQWRKSRKLELLQRIRKMVMTKDFSIRDKKLLSKLVNQQKRQGFINFGDILYYFPGKTEKMLIREYTSKRRHGMPSSWEI